MMVQGQAPLVNAEDPSQPLRTHLSNSSKSGVFGMSISQMVMGGLCVIFEISLMIINRVGYGPNYINGFVAPGIWNGGALVIVGVIGLAASKKNTMGLIVAYMILNIIVATLFMPTFIALASAAITQSALCNYFYRSYGCTNGAPVALNSLNLIMAFSQFIITIVASALCCGATCCPTRSGPSQLYYYNTPAPQQQQMGSYSVQVSGQPMMSATYGMVNGQTVCQPAPIHQGMNPQQQMMAPVTFQQAQQGVVQPPAYSNPIVIKC